MHAVVLWMSSENIFFSAFKSSSIIGLGIRVIILYLHEYSNRTQLQLSLQKNLSQESTRGFWNHTLSIWMLPFFLHARQTMPSPETMDRAAERTKAQTLPEVFDASWVKYSSQSNALMKCCYSLQKSSLLQATAWRLIASFLKLSLPAFIFQLVTFVDNIQATNNDTLTHGLELPVLGATIIFFGLAISGAASESVDAYIKLTTERMMTSAVTRKLLQVSTKSVSKFATLQLLTEHISNIGESSNIIFKAGTSAIGLAVTFKLLWDIVDVAAFVVVGVALGTTSVAYILLQQNIGSLKVWAEKSQNRRSHTRHLIQPITAAKLPKTNDITYNILKQDRENELESRDKYWSINAAVYGIITSTYALTPAMALYFCRLHPSLTGKPPMLLSFLTTTVLLSDTLKDIQEIPGFWARIQASFHYVEDFLRISSERNEDAPQIKDTEPEDEESPAVEFSNATLASSSAGPIVRDVNISLPRQSLTIVTGEVGSGKSTFLRSLVDCQLVRAGIVGVHEPVLGYCGQDPWIQNLSILENIVGPNTFERAWYRRVLNLCCLSDDIRALPGSNNFVAGRLGANLSQSLQHRIALARAIYSRATFLVLDDIFMAQSAFVTGQLITNILAPDSFIRQYSTIIMATKRTDPFHDVCDRFLKIGFNGQVADLNALEIGDETDESDDLSAQYVKQISQVPVTEATKKHRTFSRDIDAQFGQATHLHDNPDGIKYSAILAQLNLPVTILCGLLLVAQVILEELPILMLRRNFEAHGISIFLHLWSIFLTACSGILYALALHIFRTNALSTMLASVHDKLLGSIFGASISSLTSENILAGANLLCEGIQAMDLSLYHGTFNVLYSFLGVTSALSFAASQHITGIIIYPICYSYLYITYKLYAPASYQLLQLQSKTSASLCSAFAETASGADHIRALRLQAFQETYVQKVFDNKERIHAYIVSSKRWLEFAIDLMLALLNCITVAISVYMHVPSYKAGISVFVLLYMRTMTLKLFYSLEKLDACSVTLKQMEDLQSTLRKRPVTAEGPACSVWHGPGHIRFQHAFIGYNPTMETSTLRNVSINIPGGTRTGFYGSIGCGKTTLSLALLNQLPYSGSITVDDVEVRDIPHNIFRTLFTVIPQKPVTFPNATIRQNLLPDEIDPHHLRAEDNYEHTIQHVLYNVGLFDLVERVGGLATRFSQLNLTSEQLQRFSVAKGLMEHRIHRSKVVVIDGATSYVNIHTLQQLRDVMRDSFAQNECTILTASDNEPALHGSRLVFGIRYGNVLRLIGPNPVDD
ncbi:hypothetical protein VHEMI08385 [[Torrubiella] hemipterigena]|uniref:ABC transporter domain-containing protein n=1 Tax=[Torrubiella] hemipterigena TaxID=1531966 RepID=A0A0A1TDC3_9HYPO|nr:hypothetical protein VHEMI08385 [[Torrubiella] hemipterigena]